MQPKSGLEISVEFFLIDGGGCYRKMEISASCLGNQTLSPLIVHLLEQLVSFIKVKTRLKLDLHSTCQWLYEFVNNK